MFLFPDVVCAIPADVPGGRVISAPLDLYYYTVVVEYQCYENHSVMEGEAHVTCMIDGNWSHTPICHSKRFGFVLINVVSLHKL